MRLSFLISIYTASVDALPPQTLLRLVKHRPPYMPPSRTHFAERELSISGLPEPVGQQQPLGSLRSLQDTNHTIPVEGDPLCSCISVLEATPLEPSTDLSEEGQRQLVNQNTQTYGYGCGLHDTMTTDCLTARNAGVEMPKWCSGNWCWVNASSCSLAYKLDSWVVGRSHSYATCRNLDFFHLDELARGLKGLKLKVGLVSNSGGWMGVYSNDSSHFEGPLDRWKGPTLDFVKNASAYAGFEMEVTPLSQVARDRAITFFNRTSVFDQCIYAAALGLVDFCISQMSISSQRVLLTDWFVMRQEDIRLITQIQGIVLVTDWFTLLEKFGKSFDILTQPFETSTWFFLILLFMPLMGILFVFHEYGRSGSIYPHTETELIEEVDMTIEVRSAQISCWSYMPTALYNATLSILKGGYEEPVVSYGGFIHLLGVSFFIMTIIAVYTANMAAILTDRATQGDVNSIIRALRANYRFCADRSIMKIAIQIHSNLLRESMFMIDPVDGLPGYLDKRSLILDNLDVKLASQNSSFCHAAIGRKQDLDYLQSLSMHCNKSAVGKSVATLISGMPLSERYSSHLKAVFSRMLNANALSKADKKAQPKARCSKVESQVRGETKSLSIEQLAGIWYMTFGFATVGMLVHYFKPWVRISIESQQERRERKVLAMMSEANGDKALVYEET